MNLQLTKYLRITDSELGAVKVQVDGEGRQTLWGKTKRAFEYLYQHHMQVIPILYSN